MPTTFNLNVIDPSWQSCIQEALNTLNPHYKEQLNNTQWLPGPDKILNAFSLPLSQVNYVLFGESPYPRVQSANGYAFWDAAVTDVWSPTGLSKPVNRATSLRNFIKMLLVAEGLLTANQTDQPAIAAINKQHLIQTNRELFENLLQKGFLLLNASLVLQPTAVQKDARAWQPFLKYVLDFLLQKRPHVQLILFGRIAHEIDQLLAQPNLKKLYAEHPYNHSFIDNTNVLAFFKPLHLLNRIVYTKET